MIIELDFSQLVILILLISHRLSVFENLNKIILINENRTFEYGSHDKLIEKSNLYNQLFKLQQRKDEEYEK